MAQPLTVLMVHSRYLERGGEDVVYEAESALLESAGVRVLRYERDNRELVDMSRPQAALRTVWHGAAARDIANRVRRDRVDVVHVHNTFPLISPAAHHGAKRAGAAVVQTLHNFRLLCPAGVFMRDGRPCESCLGRATTWPAVVHRCYRDDAAASAVVTGMLTVHRALRTWHSQVDAFIALSRFARDRFVAGGLPADRIHVNGGLVPGVAAARGAPAGAPVLTGDGSAAVARVALTGGEAAAEPVTRAHDWQAPTGRRFLFVGRLAAEKGIDRLLDAWRLLPEPWELQIIGDGPLAHRVRAAAAADARVSWSGARPPEQVAAAMRESWALVFPSQCYENYPIVLAEAQAAGLPVVASRLGSTAEIVEDGGFGVLFDAADTGALAAAIRQVATDPAARAGYAARAAAAWRERLNPDRYLSRLRGIYAAALAGRGHDKRHGAHAADATVNDD